MFEDQYSGFLGVDCELQIAADLIQSIHCPEQLEVTFTNAD